MNVGNTLQLTASPRDAQGRAMSDAVLGLVIQLHRRAAQLHGRIAFKLDTAAGLFFNLVHPRFVHGEPHIGLWRHEGVKLECYGLLRQA